jgi:hypothetical protein
VRDAVYAWSLRNGSARAALAEYVEASDAFKACTPPDKRRRELSKEADRGLARWLALLDAHEARLIASRKGAR